MNTARFWPRNFDFRHVRATVTSVTISRGCAQIKHKSSQPFALRLFSLRIIISFGFIFAQAYASSEHCCEDTRKYLLSLLLLPFLYILHLFHSFSLVHTRILLSFCVFLIVLPFPIRISRFLHCRLHKIMYITLFQSKLQSDIVPPSLRTLRALGALAFCSRSTCAPRRTLTTFSHHLAPS
jgi:hypothetical protein